MSYNINKEIASVLNNAENVILSDSEFNIVKEVTKEELEFLKEHTEMDIVVSVDNYDVYIVSSDGSVIDVGCKFEFSNLEDIIKYTSMDYWLSQLNIYKSENNMNIKVIMLKVIEKLTVCTMIDEVTRCKYINRCIKGYEEAIMNFQLDSLDKFIKSIDE